MVVWKKWNCYEVSDDGRIRRNGRELTLCTHTKGYQTVTVSIDGKVSKRLFHGVVLEAFKGQRPEGQQARHLDGNKTNNCPGNLEWGTAKENDADKDEHGTRLTCENHPRAKLTQAQVDEVRNSDLPASVWAERLNVHPTTIYRVRNEIAWVP